MADTVASQYASGAVLLPEQQVMGDASNDDIKEEFTIGYWSKTLSFAERDYYTAQRVCLSVFWVLKNLRPYMKGTQFSVRTAHDALKWMLNMPEGHGRITRRRLIIINVYLIVTYRPGQKIKSWTHCLGAHLMVSTTRKLRMAFLHLRRTPWYQPQLKHLVTEMKNSRRLLEKRSTSTTFRMI